MGKMLVTGAAGFIGRHLTRALLEAGHEVHAVDSIRSLTGAVDPVAGWPLLRSARLPRLPFPPEGLPGLVPPQPGPGFRCRLPSRRHDRRRAGDGQQPDGGGRGPRHRRRLLPMGGTGAAGALAALEFLGGLSGAAAAAGRLRAAGRGDDPSRRRYRPARHVFWLGQADRRIPRAPGA